MQGKIIKGIAGFYYVVLRDGSHKGSIYECKAKGIFRKEQKKPLVGDDVIIDILDEAEQKGNIIELLPRHSEMIRPAVANVDQALILFSVAKPQPNFNLLDRFLIMMENQGLDCSICFNKQDIAEGEEMNQISQIYRDCGYRVFAASAETNQGIEELRSFLAGKTTALAGPSGVGKSSIVNRLKPEARMETGNISEKIERGKHTTRHSEIIALREDTFIMDTPGFTSLKLFDLESGQLKDYYPEFKDYESHCRFHGCLHLSEPDCKVKSAVERGRISAMRYENYHLLHKELKESKKY